MNAQEIFGKLATLKVVPIVVVEEADKALPLADAMLEGGMRVMEITFRTPAAEGAIRAIRAKRPEMMVGAGTLLTVEQVERAAGCGAEFAVAPGLNRRVVEAAGRAGLAFAPGVMTPSDVEAGLEMGLRVLKVFPAETIGGVGMIKALGGPYGHTGVKFVPTGGINERNFRAYLALPNVLAVGGTWLATREDVSQGRWGEITERCRAVLAG